MDKTELYQFLLNYVSPEYALQISDLYGVCIEYDLGEVDTGVDVIVGKIDELDPSSVADTIAGYIVDFVTKIMTDEGVVFREDYSQIDFVFLTALLTNHIGIKTLEDTQWIHDLIMYQIDDTENHDIYYEILTGINSMAMENYYEYVLSVTDDLIDKILDMTSYEIEDEDMPDESIDNYNIDFVRIYKENAVVKNIIQKYFDVRTTHSLDDVLNDSVIAGVYCLEAEYNTSELIIALWLLIHSKDTVDLNALFEEQSTLIPVVKLVTTCRNESDVDVMLKVVRTLKTYLTKNTD